MNLSLLSTISPFLSLSLFLSLDLSVSSVFLYLPHTLSMLFSPPSFSLSYSRPISLGLWVSGLFPVSPAQTTSGQSIILGTGGAGGPLGREQRGRSMGMGLQAASVPTFGCADNSDNAEEGDSRKSHPRSLCPWIGRWAGGAEGRPEAATRSRSRSRAPSHTSVDPIRVLAQNPGKLPTPGTSTLPHYPHLLDPKIRDPGHPRYPPRIQLPQAQTPWKTKVTFPSFPPWYTHPSCHQLQIGKIPKKVQQNFHRSMGQGRGQSDRESRAGWGG